MATIDDLKNLNYVVSIQYTVSGYGNSVVLPADAQDIIDSLADMDSICDHLLRTHDWPSASLLSIMRATGWQREHNATPGFPDAPDVPNFTWDLTDPDGQTELDVPASRFAEVKDAYDQSKVPVE